MTRTWSTAAVAAAALVLIPLYSCAGNAKPKSADAQTPKAKPPPLRVCMLSGSLEYNSDASLALYKDYLEKRYDVRCTLLRRRAKDRLPGLEALENCDVAIVFTRRMTIDGADLARIKKYCLAGKPIVGIRTASHAFQKWLALDKEVFGGKYKGHFGNGPITQVKIAPKASGHPILTGVKTFTSIGSLYKNTGLATDTNVLLTGSIPGHTEPIAWTRIYKGARIFYTSLGHVQDFKNENFLRLITNGLFWVVKREPPKPTGAS